LTALPASATVLGMGNGELSRRHDSPDDRPRPSEPETERPSERDLDDLFAPREGGVVDLVIDRLYRERESEAPQPEQADPEPPWARRYETVVDRLTDRLDADRSSTQEQPTDAIDVHVLDENEAHDFVNRPDWAERLEAAERLAVNNYKLADGYRLNHCLRHGELTSEDHESIRSLDSAIDKGEIDRDVVLYRGTNMADADNLHAGDVLSDEGYVSTSALERVASGEVFCQPHEPGAVLMEIEVPRGSRAAFPETLIDFGESEVLLPRGSSFRVLSVSPDEDVGKRIRARLED
jgi:hypothetical protein